MTMNVYGMACLTAALADLMVAYIYIYIYSVNSLKNSQTHLRSLVK